MQDFLKNHKTAAITVVALVFVFAVVFTVNGQSTFWDGVADKVATILAGKVEMPAGPDASFGAGTRFPNGISADTTSPSAGQVRGTTLTTTGAATLASASVTGNLVVSGLVNGGLSSTTTTSGDFTLTGDETGKIVLFGTTGATTTLPAVTESGAVFIFSVQTAFDTNDMTILSAEGDNIDGSLFVNDAIVACSGEDKIQFWADGEQIGDFVELFSDGTSWNIIDSRGEGSGKMTCDDDA